MTVGELSAVQVGLGPRAVQGEEAVAEAIKLGPEERTDGGLSRVRELQRENWREQGGVTGCGTALICFHLYQKEMGSNKVLQLWFCPRGDGHKTQDSKHKKTEPKAETEWTRRNRERKSRTINQTGSEV